MTDRELLELAAKAAGLKIHAARQAERDEEGCANSGLWIVNGSTCWNPLTDDGDALRVAVMRGMEVNIDWAKLCVRVWDGIGKYYYEQLSTDSINCDIEPHAATRRAIVRAAAEIGRGMK